MATTYHPWGPSSGLPANRPAGNNDQLRRDRLAAGAAVLLVAALVALVLWLASQSGGGQNLDLPNWMM